MKYSFNQERDGVVFANTKDVNASFKDLGMVCAAIRYRSVTSAMGILDDTIALRMPIAYPKHSKHMGARHELGGRKGRWPRKCAAIVRKVLVNASANATNKGFDPESMYVIHAAANKTSIGRRGPPKGALFVTGGPIGFVTPRHSDLEFARVEIGISELDEKRLNGNMVRRIKAGVIASKAREKAQPKKVKQPEKKKPGILVKAPQKGQPQTKPAAAKPEQKPAEPQKPAQQAKQPEQKQAAEKPKTEEKVQE